MKLLCPNSSHHTEEEDEEEETKNEDKAVNSLKELWAQKMKKKEDNLKLGKRSGHEHSASKCVKTADQNRIMKQVNATNNEPIEEAMPGQQHSQRDARLAKQPAV